MVLAFTSQITPIDCTHNLQKKNKKIKNKSKNNKKKKESLVRCSIWGLSEVWS